MRASTQGTTIGGRAPTTRNSRARGSIDTLPSGSLRIRVYAGIDPITHHQHYLTHTVPPGPTAARDAEAVQRRLVTMVEEGRHPRTCASLTHLIDRHLAALHASAHSLDSYRGYLRKHINPLIGHVRIGAATPEILDCFYAELARCRDHCHTPAYRASTTQAFRKRQTVDQEAATYLQTTRSRDHPQDPLPDQCRLHQGPTLGMDPRQPHLTGQPAPQAIAQPPTAHA